MHIYTCIYTTIYALQINIHYHICTTYIQNIYIYTVYYIYTTSRLQYMHYITLHQFVYERSVLLSLTCTQCAAAPPHWRLTRSETVTTVERYQTDSGYIALLGIRHGGYAAANWDSLDLACNLVHVLTDRCLRLS